MLPIFLKSRPISGSFLVLTALLFLLPAPPPARSEELSIIPQADQADPKKAQDSVEATIERRNAMDYDPTKHSMFPDFYNKIRTWRGELFQKMRMEASLSYDMLGQSYADTDSSQSATAGDITFNARWLMFGYKYIKPVYLVFRLRHRHSYGDLSPSMLGPENGLLWKSTDGFTNAAFQVPDLYFNQELFDGNLTLRYGQYGADSFFDNHNLRSAKRFFLNQMFSNNPSVGFPSYGTGFALQWRDKRNWDISFGGSNIQSTNALDREEVNLSLSSSALFYAIQGGYNFKGLGKRDARLQLMIWNSDRHSEEQTPAGKGTSLTLEHVGSQPTERYVARLAYSEGKATTVDCLMMVGYGRETRKYDHYGIGIGVGRSAVNHSRWQGVTEIYYRWQVTKELLITPDLQLITGRGLHGNNTFSIVAGIRAGFTF